MKTPFRWLINGLVLGSVLIGSQVMAQEELEDGEHRNVTYTEWQNRPLIQATQPLLTSCIAPHEPLLVAATATGIYAWNYETGQGQWGITDLDLALGEEVRHLRYSADGKLLLAGAETFEQPGKLFLYDMAKRQQLKTVMAEGIPTAFAYSPNGQRVAVGLSNNVVRIYSLPDLAEVKKLEGLTVAPTALSWSQDGKTLQAAGGGHTTGNLDKKNWQPVVEGGALGLTEQTQGQTARWEVETGKLQQKFPVAPGGPDMVYNDQGSMLASMGGAVKFEKYETSTRDLWEGTHLSVFEVSATAQTQPQAVGTYINDKDFMRTGPRPIMAWSPDGTHLVFTNMNSGKYFIWDGTQTVYIRAEDSFSYLINRFFFSPKGDQLIAVSDQAIRVWQRQEGGEGENAPEDNDAVF